MFFIKETNTTPSVKISVVDELFEIKGNSNNSDVNEFYDNILNELIRQFPNFKTKLDCIFNFNVFNSSSLKKTIQLLIFLNDKFNSNYKIRIKWIFNETDIDNEIIGKDLSEIFDLPFEITELKKE